MIKSNYKSYAARMKENIRNYYFYYTTPFFHLRLISINDVNIYYYYVTVNNVIAAHKSLRRYEGVILGALL